MLEIVQKAKKVAREILRGELIADRLTQISITKGEIEKIAGDVEEVKRAKKLISSHEEAIEKIEKGETKVSRVALEETTAKLLFEYGKHKMLS